MTRLWRVDYRNGDYVFFTYTQNSKHPTRKRIKEIFDMEWDIDITWCIKLDGETWDEAIDVSDWGIMEPGMYLIPTNTE